MVRAFYEWILDNECTPYLLVDATAENVVVPIEYIQDGKIILNISPTAVPNLQVENDWLTFSARFSGRAMDVSVPITAVLAIYAKENGQGMLFEQEEGQPTPPEPDTKSPERPSLKVVK